MKEETVKKFEVRYEEDCDVESDELYTIWLKLKTLTLSDVPKSTESTTSSELKSVQLKDILVYPGTPVAKKGGNSTSDMPKHLTGEQMIAYMEEKKKTKRLKEEEKVRKKEERARKKKNVMRRKQGKQ